MSEGTEYYLLVNCCIEVGRKIILNPAVFSTYSVPNEKESNLLVDV